MSLQQYWLVMKNNNKEQQHLILMPSKDILAQIILRFLLGSQKLKSPSSCHNKKSNEIPSAAKGWLRWGLH